MITNSVEISRPQEEVFAYLDALERHGEWQDQIVSAKIESEGPVGVGTKVVEVRKIGSRQQRMGYEITEHDPPRRSSFRGTDGPIRPIGTTTVEPLGDGSGGSKVTIEFDLIGHGVFGKLIAPMARKQARATIAANQANLKAELEGGAAA